MDYELDELRREFLAEAYEKVREIESRIESRIGPESVQRLTYLAHQLKGSGGSYGFQRISTDAAELEKAAENLASGSDGDGSERKIHQHVANLREEIVKQSDQLADAER
jgi:HPt (histidine-containing phosphotransfer) domain-containing protein